VSPTSTIDQTNHPHIDLPVMDPFDQDLLDAAEAAYVSAHEFHDALTNLLNLHISVA